MLEQRGDGAAGWSRVWKMCTWARLFDGNRANKIFKGYIKEQCTKSMFGKCYAAMQVDASFGLEAAVNEMLVQSHEGYIQLLPALPDEWSSSGSMQGVVTRGAFVLDFSWKNGVVQNLSLLSRAGSECKIKSNMKIIVKRNGTSIQIAETGNGIYAFNTEKNGKYEIEFLP